MSSPSRVEFPEVYEALVAGELNASLVQRTFEAILSGGWTPGQIAAFIASMRVAGESAEVIAAAARAMRSAMVPVQHGLPQVLDTCGTGGDGTGTINLSTGAAIVCAALGIPVAKHGNRAVSSRAGSADVVSALGIPVELEASASAAVLREANIAFLMAPVHHPAMRHAAPVRKDLRIRTIFNCLGPLANPAGATHQLVGAYSDAVRPVLARALAELGSVRAWVVRGEDGMDEVTPYGVTRVSCVDGGRYTEFEICPEDFGLPVSAKDAAAGGDAAENAAILTTILSGAPHPARDAVVLNAAAAVVVAQDLAPKAAALKVQGVLNNGKALATLHRWRDVANSNRRVEA